MLSYRICKNQALEGEIRVPGDKSISHRAIMLGAIAAGVTQIDGFLFGADNLATLQAMRQLGVQIKCDTEKFYVTIEGVGIDGLQQSDAALDMGNSGTAMRLMSGLLAGQKFSSELIGDESLNRRPMARVVDPLKQMGAKISLSAQGTAPIKIAGEAQLTAIQYTLPVASAQVKSALLLAGIYAQGETEIIEPAVTRDHTERMLRAFAYPVQSHARSIKLTGGHRLQATRIHVPSDISSAAFFMVAASIIPGSHIILRDVGINPTRDGILQVLRAMGADIQLLNPKTQGDEPVADIEIRAAQLKGVNIGAEWVALAIDEIPVLMIAAACAQGETRITGARELRVKETDRIAAMASGLATLGISHEVLADGIIIQGGQFGGGTVQSFGDHRIAMAFAVAGCVASDPVVVTDCKNVATSFPNFVALATQLGFNLTEHQSS